jgi:hypothetical protein
MLFKVPSTGGFKNNILFDGFKNQKKIRETSKVEKTRVYAQKPRLKMPFKNSISGLDDSNNTGDVFIFRGKTQRDKITVAVEKYLQERSKLFRANFYDKT